MAIGKKVKKKSSSTIEAVRRVAQNPENARNVKGISTQRNSYRVSTEKKQYSDTRSNVGRKGGGQANRGISAKQYSDYIGSTKPKSISGSAMQLKTSYRNAVKSRSNYKHPDQMASDANNSTRADVYGRVSRGKSVGKTKQDFKNISTRKSTASNMKRRYLREISDFDLQTGDYARAEARAGANLGRRAKWEGKENTTGFYRTTSPDLRKKPKRKGK